MIKNKIGELDLSATLKINEISKNLEKQGKKIIKFGFGQSPFQVPTEIVEELKKNAHQKSKSENKQNKIDIILDKISKSGYDSLNDEEKKYLFKQGKDK